MFSQDNNTSNITTSIFISTFTSYYYANILKGLMFSLFYLLFKERLFQFWCKDKTNNANLQLYFNIYFSTVFFCYVKKNQYICFSIT